MMRRLIALSVGLVAAAAMLLTTTGAAAAATRHEWFVDDDGRGSATGCKGNAPIPTSIQTAIDNASAGDEVEVCPGKYIERLDIHKDRLDVDGTKEWAATVQAPANVPADAALVYIHDAVGAAVFQLNLVFPTSGPCATYGDAVRVVKALGSNIQGNHIGISGNESSCHYSTGIHIVSGADAEILKNKITDFSDSGIVLAGKESRIERNTINFLHARLGPNALANAHGIDVSATVGQTPVIVTQNVIKSASTAGGSTPMLSTGILVAKGPALVTGNTISYADTAIQLDNAQDGSTYRNTAITGIGWGLLIHASSNYDIGVNRFSTTIAGIAATGGSTGNSIHDNDARGPSKPDCTDTTSGSGTSGTANTWSNNQGTSTPSGLCAP